MACFVVFVGCCCYCYCFCLYLCIYFCFLNIQSLMLLWSVAAWLVILLPSVLSYPTLVSCAHDIQSWLSSSGALGNPKKSWNSWLHYQSLRKHYDVMSNWVLQSERQYFQPQSKTIKHIEKPRHLCVGKVPRRVARIIRKLEKICMGISLILKEKTCLFIQKTEGR